MDKIQALVALLVTLSMASERLVEIIKNMVPWLNTAQAPDSVGEGRRKAALQTLAGVAGVITALLSQPVLLTYTELFPAAKTNGTWFVLALGILASAGSGFWNAILSYLLQLKELKKMETKNPPSATTLPPGQFPEVNLGEEQMTSNSCYDIQEDV